MTNLVITPNQIISESLYGDFNGDGKSDVITYYPTTNPYWDMGLSTGSLNAELSHFNLGSFLQSPSLTMSNDNKEITHFVVDMNGDGKSDIVEIEKSSATTIFIYYSNGINFEAKSYPISILIDTKFDEIDFGDFNGDGKPDMLIHKIGVGGGSGSAYTIIYFEKNGKEQLLEGISDGFNNVTEFTYDYLTNNSIYTKGINANHPVVDVQSPLPVVSKVKVPNGIGGDDITTYTYQGAKVHKNGKGFLGFEKIVSENNVSDLRITTLYKLNIPFFISNAIKRSTELISSGQALSEITFEYVYRDLGNKRVFPFMQKSISTDLLTNFTTTSIFTYDNFGNITNSYITKGNIETVEIFNTYGQHGSWLPSKLELTTITTIRQGESPYVRTTEFLYTPQGKIVQKINDSGSPKELNTSYTYNTMGNQISTTISGTGIPPRTTSYVYDTKGRYIEKITNPLNQISISIYDPKWGLPLSIVGYDGLITRYEYDEFGTLIAQITPDNIKTEKILNWDLGNGGMGSPTTVDNSIYTEKTITPGKPTIKTWFDSFGRQRQTEIEGFSQKIYQVIGYDERGNIKTQTSPFYLGGSIPIVVTTNSYNSYNKIISSQNAAGTTNYNYSYSQNQESITVTNPDFTVYTQVIDATGKMISASDNGGTLNYAYYSSGLQKEVNIGGISITSMEYDIQGNQTKLMDKNAGEIIYEYNVLGELIYQKDANLYEYEMEYDLLGRMIKQTEITTNLITDYVFGVSGNGINQLISVIENENNYSEEYTYDNLGRTTEIKETIDNVDYITKYGYDGFNNIISTTYPSGYIIENTYTPFGYMNKVTNGTTIIWQGTDADAYSNYTNFSTGNGLTVSKEYDEYGFPLHFLASNSSVLDLSFVVDVKNGNLLSRENITKGLLEEFEYDNLNRLTKTTLNGIVQLNMNYISNGNIDFKTDAGVYTYDNNKINAVLTATNPNNDISSLQQDITYTPFNSPASIIEGTNELLIKYGTGQQRRKTQLLSNGSLKYTKYFLGNYEKIVDAVTNDITEIHYIAGGDGLTAIYVIKNGVGELNYTYTNQLGSILTLTDDIGNVVVEQSFDAWGRYRDPQTWQLTSTSGISSTYSWLTRGYTGHEHLPEFGLINMNGRVYDPVLARMLSVDNFVASPFSTQAYNRYSYVFNNPLKFIDPNGENPILVGAIIGFLIGAYYGLEYGSNKGARGWSLVRYTVGGGIIGGIAGALGGGIAAGGGAFANTSAIVAGSFSNSLGMHMLSNGETNVSVSYGFGSYNFNTNDFGYLGEKNNTFGQNFGYGLGALANISDLVTRADNIKAIDRKNNPMSGKTEQELQQIFDETSNTRLNRFLNKKSDAANFAGNSASNISPKEFLSIDRIDLLPLDGKENGLFGGFQHDLAYYNAGTDGARGVFFNTNVTSADFKLIQGMTEIIRGGGFTRDVIFVLKLSAQVLF
ncbi:MAG: toxin TcdB middle/N-terminal domain-containing protein [Vicingaceae bacterium]|nr:toxin TcdB middle/N-terminal domain-containing protein [Vicingaceae bacterium]